MQALILGFCSSGYDFAIASSRPHLTMWILQVTMEFVGNYVMEYIEAPFTLENTKDFLNKNALSYPPRVFALEYKENKKLIGHIIFHEYDKESYEIGFILSQDYWGCGIADEITKSLINYAKNKNIHSLIIECDKRQLATQKITTNNNFKLISSEDLLVYELDLE